MTLLASWLVRAALLFHPASFRREFGEDVCADHASVLEREGLARFLRSLAETVYGGAQARVERFGSELLLAARRMRRHPGFAASVAATFAIGVGVNVAVFSVLSAVLFAPTPLGNMDHLARISVRPPMHPEYGFISREHIQAIAAAPFTKAVAAYYPSNQRIALRVPGVVYGLRAYPGALQALGIRAELGSAHDADLPGHAALGDEFWRSHFGADPSILGKLVRVDGASYIVGAVLPPHLVLPGGFGGVIPFQIMETQGVPAFLASGAQPYTLAVEYKRGWTIAAIDRVARAIGSRISLKDDIGKTAVTSASDLRETMIGPRFTFYAWSLFAATLAVVLIACANASTLVLAFTLTRTNEFALRRELGAKREEVLGQLLSEALVLALPGAACGVAIAALLIHPLNALLFQGAYNADRAHVDTAALFYSLALTMTATVAAAFAPFVHVARQRSSALRGAGLGSAVRGVLVVAEIGSAFALIFCTVLLARDVMALMHQPLGMNTAHVAVTSYPYSSAQGSSAKDGAAIERTTLARLSSLPGVTKAAISFNYPLSTTTMRIPVGVPGNTLSQTPPVVTGNAVSAGYFAALGIPVVRGRAFTADDDDARHAPVVIVDQLFVDRYMRGRTVVGARIQMPEDPKPQWATIVGVAGTVRPSLTEDPMPTVYFPFLQSGVGMFFSIVRGTLPADVLARELSVAAYPHMGSRHVDTQTFGSVIAQQTADQRSIAELFGALAIIAAILALTGIYGVVAFSVRLRTREFGIRLALGATGMDIVGSVVRRAVVLALAGIGIGLILSAFAQRMLAPNLYIVKRFDPLTLFVAACSMLAVALVAAIIPASSAVSVDPAASLRYE